ncbi:MAG: 4Fe-4S dicluster domain-containing protein [Proteobacteria bacterium]|nr:4Fe-4S dicluster domain-containing protein [Pseudomonadota bacterium]MBU1640635.1 4Fe-4S dicluster domain-containing protein [Pseudomonadota bacterium]
MIFKIIAARELALFFDILAVNKIVGPVKKGSAADGRALYDFDVVYDLAELSLDFDQTIHPAKKYFLPYLEETCSFAIRDKGWEKEVDYGAYRPVVLFGLHACDINALNKLDKVLLAEPYPNRFYAAKRASMFIVGHSCQPTPACFCHAMGTDSVLQGCDLFLTPMGDEYFVEIFSSRAYHILENLNLREPGSKDHKLFQEAVEARKNLFTAEVDTSDLTKILDMEFDSPVWDQWGEKCLSCGTCAQVCPTCYCYGVEEVVAMDMASAGKIRQLYSCNLLDFAEVAGGHNFRPESRGRLKYRYYHKHRGFVEAFEEALCVGCGRCGTNCLADINVPEVIASVRGGEVEDV